MELTTYIRARIRPRRYAHLDDDDAERHRPSLVSIAAELDVDPRHLNHMLAGKQNWTAERVEAVAGIIGGDAGYMMDALERDRALPGALRPKRGQPRKEKCESP